jgi:hypothetical protein
MSQRNTECQFGGSLVDMSDASVVKRYKLDEVHRPQAAAVFL